MKTCLQRGAGLACGWLWLIAVSVSAQITAPRLEILRPEVPVEWMRLNSTFHSNTVLTLAASTNLTDWQSVGTLHNALFAYPDAATPDWQTRYYRLAAATRKPTDDWKNQILYPTDPFRSTNSVQNVNWVKFAILLDDLTRVYYQDSRKYLFHYDFATQRLPAFLGMDHAAFDAVSLWRTNQQVVLGTVLYSPMTTLAEYGVQFVGLDAYTPEEIGRWFELVKATVHAATGAEAFYMPTFEQADVARTNAAAFADLGIPVAAMDRWVTINPCYSTGWAVGQLKFFPASEVAAAFADGRLRPEDILLTDGVPADAPLVAGILTLTPSTPNSHTAILSQSFGLPFAYLADADEQARVLGLVGRKVLVRATVSFGAAQIKVVDVEGQFDPAFEAELLAAAMPAPLNFQPRQPYGALWASTDALVPADIQYFGGKAANYGFLRRAIPTNCPFAIAFAFDLWDQFLDQTLPGGDMLRARIAARLAPYTNYPPDVVSLKADLAVVRDLFTDTAQFNAVQQQAITNALTPFFNPLRKIRFRSSTNVEDSESFTGAGLYDSYSGCLMDDLDGNTSGPSHCDAAESKERGVFRAMQKVYASFYNDDAFLARLLHRVDEDQVAMGVLVHHSFPDEEELANGVALPRFTFTGFNTNLSGDLVTQLGAESVSNPEGGAVPEIVTVSRYSGSINTTNLTLKQYSSRVPLGTKVMDWPADYSGLVELFRLIGLGFRHYYPAKTSFTLDFEYKKDLNLGLVVKQVREAPKAGTNVVTAFLIDEPVTHSVWQVEGGSVFANHRLKSLWNLHTANLRMFPSNLVHGIYTEGICEYVETGALQTLTGALNTWPDASNAPSGSVNYWTTGSGVQQRAWRLQTTLATTATGAQPPVFTQADFPKTVTVNYAAPVTNLHMGSFGAITNETVWLEPQPALVPGALFQERTFARTNAADVVTIQTTFYWPKRPGGIVIYTAPLLQFAETRITGLTAAPIVLTNYYSQTYNPGHHNFSEEFIFEPQLEPGLPPATLAELNAANIRLIYAYRPASGSPILYLLGLDQHFRAL
jgi:hypothetical protein